MLAMDSRTLRGARFPALSLTTIATVRRFDRLAPTGGSAFQHLGIFFQRQAMPASVHAAHGHAVRAVVSDVSLAVQQEGINGRGINSGLKKRGC